MLGTSLSFLAPRAAVALPLGAVDQVMRGETPPGKEGRALEKGLTRMAALTGSAEKAAAELKQLGVSDSDSLNRYLDRLETCDGDLTAARTAHSYFEKQPDLAGSFARLAEVTPGSVEEVVEHCEYLRQHTAPGKERERKVDQWVQVLREQQLHGPDAVVAFLTRPVASTPPPAAPAPTPTPAPVPVEPEPPGPRQIAEELLARTPVSGLTSKKLANALDTAANYLNGLDAARSEMEQVLGQLKKPEELDRYTRFLELTDGQNGQALQGFLYARDEKAARAVEVMLRDNHTVDELKWLASKLPKNADLARGAESYVRFSQTHSDNALFERSLGLPPEAAAHLEHLEEVGMRPEEALDDLEHLSKNGFKPEDYQLLRSLRERTPSGTEVRTTLDFLASAPPGEVREERQKAYLKLVEVGNDPVEALKDLQWLSKDRPAAQLAQATETYLDLLGRVRPEHHDELRDCYQKLHENAPPASSPRIWFRKPVTYEGAYGTLLQFDPDPTEALTDLRVLQKHSATDLRGGLKDLGDLFKLGNARDSEAVRTAYELLQSPPRFMNREQLKKLITQLANETDDLGLGARTARLLTHSPSEGEFRARRRAFTDYLEQSFSNAQTVELLETAEEHLPPTDDLLKIHPVLLEQTKLRGPDVVKVALTQSAAALERGRVDGKSSSELFRSYLNVLCKSQHTEEARKLGEVLVQEGDSAWSMARIMEPMLDACPSVGEAVNEYHFVRDLRTREWPDCPSSVEELSRTHAGSILLLRQAGQGRGARELLTWTFEHRNIQPEDLLGEVGRRLLLGSALETAKAEALEHFENGGRIKDKEDHVVIGGVRIGKNKS